MSLGIGLIGLGRHGMRYVHHIQEMGSRARLVSVCRRDLTLGSAFATQYGVRFHQDHRELIADPTVEAVIVVTPPSLAPAICMEAVRARKPMLIEKPLALDAPAARMMASAAESARVPLMTAQTLRFDSTIQALIKEIAGAGACRHLALTYHLEPVHTSAQEGSPFKENILYEIGTHLFDLIRVLTGDDIVDVRCELTSPSPPESRANVVLRTEKHVPCFLDVARIGTQRLSRIEWTGVQGQVSADWVRGRLRRIAVPSGLCEWTVKPCPTVAETVRAFVDALESGAPMPVTGWDGYKAVAVADACAASAASGLSVRVQD